ncbi:hypothetical protein GCM10022420_041490 [Streptomyces iranensis]
MFVAATLCRGRQYGHTSGQPQKGAEARGEDRMAVGRGMQPVRALGLQHQPRRHGPQTTGVPVVGFQLHGARPSPVAHHIEAERGTTLNAPVKGAVPRRASTGDSPSFGILPAFFA